MLKPNVSKMKNARGRIVGYRATLKPGSLEGQGPTPKLAAEALEDGIRHALDRLERGGFSGEVWGHCYAAWPTLYGWSYSLDTFQPGYTVGHPPSQSLEQVCDSAIHHLGQNLWTPETNDHEFLNTKGVSPKVAAE